MQGQTRRNTLRAMAATGAMLMAGKGLAEGSEAIVETSGGRVRGVAEKGALVFRGLRYAVAERFMPPRPPQPAAGITDASRFGASAPQSNANPPPGPPYVITAQLPRPANAPPPVKLPESEDCLFLNVWTPAVSGKLPVMLWLHGGFFYGGSGSTTDGSRIAARGDAVVVSVNHRLNAFGYTHLGDIAGADFAHSGNVGMLDIVAALQWVRENIARFGGDPKRVMVFGTSGGGMKTSFLMASPAARGMFHRAGVQSGPGLRFMERDAATAVTELLLIETGIARANSRDLAKLPMEKLLAGYHAVAAKLPPRRFIDLPCFAPVIDPQLLPQHPFSPKAAPGTRDIPMLIGCNAQEMSFFWGNDPEAFTLDDAGLQSRARQQFGDRADAIVALYRKTNPDAAPPRLWLQMFSDYSLLLPVVAQAERHAAAGGRTWAYRLDFQSPAMGGKLGALHTLEGPFLFDTIESARALVGPGEEPVALAARMSRAWAHFAATGEPAADGLPQWPRYDKSARRTMLFDTRCRIESDPSGILVDELRPLLGV